MLDGEPQDDADYDERLHIVYRLRSDGLYEDKDGNLFANMYNYGREYYDERASYYAAGASEPTNFADLDEDTVYYISAEEAAKTDTDGNNNGEQSPHYLVAQNSDGTTTKVFRYENGEYRYIITTTDDEGNAEVTYSEQPVSNFKIGGEDGVALRYDNTDSARQLMAALHRPRRQLSKTSDTTQTATEWQTPGRPLPSLFTPATRARNSYSNSGAVREITAA